MAVPKELMSVLACPKCRGEVEEKGMFISCRRCGLAYPVLENVIPDMLIEDAWPLPKARKAGFRHKLTL